MKVIKKKRITAAILDTEGQNSQSLKKNSDLKESPKLIAKRCLLFR